MYYVYKKKRVFAGVKTVKSPPSLMLARIVDVTLCAALFASTMKGHFWAKSIMLCYVKRKEKKARAGVSNYLLIHTSHILLSQHAHLKCK